MSYLLLAIAFALQNSWCWCLECIPLNRTYHKCVFAKEVISCSILKKPHCLLLRDVLQPTKISHHCTTPCCQSHSWWHVWWIVPVLKEGLRSGKKRVCEAGIEVATEKWWIDWFKPCVICNLVLPQCLYRTRDLYVCCSGRFGSQIPTGISIHTYLASGECVLKEGGTLRAVSERELKKWVRKFDVGEYERKKIN